MKKKQPPRNPETYKPKRPEYPYQPIYGKHKHPEYHEESYLPARQYYVEKKYYGTYVTKDRPKYISHSLDHSCFHPSPEYYVPPSGNECETVDPQTGLSVRINQNAMSVDQQNRFLNAYNQINNAGFLGPLVTIHSNGAHMMHGNLRFLPWHRVYLLRLEEMLQSVDPSVTIPYWRSSQDQAFPSWLNGVLPTVNGHTVSRNIGLGVSLPDVGAVNSALANNSFNSFAQALEGIHNTGHVWVGGSMATVQNAPCDPVFWMHHAEIDRIWAEWQGLNPGLNPNLTGTAAVMDPWTETETDTRDITAMGFTYA